MESRKTERGDRIVGRGEEEEDRGKNSDVKSSDVISDIFPRSNFKRRPHE